MDSCWNKDNYFHSIFSVLRQFLPNGLCVNNRFPAASHLSRSLKAKTCPVSQETVNKCQTGGKMAQALSWRCSFSWHPVVTRHQTRAAALAISPGIAALRLEIFWENTRQLLKTWPLHQTIACVLGRRFHRKESSLKERWLEKEIKYLLVITG